MSLISLVLVVLILRMRDVGKQKLIGYNIYSTIVLSFFVIFTALFILTFSEKSNFLDLAFEIVSAYGTVGLSRGLTEKLSFFGKVIIMFVMFVGRVGVFNLALVMIKESHVANYQYPEEEVVVS